MEQVEFIYWLLSHLHMGLDIYLLSGSFMKNIVSKKEDMVTLGYFIT